MTLGAGTGMMNGNKSELHITRTTIDHNGYSSTLQLVPTELCQRKEKGADSCMPST